MTALFQQTLAITAGLLVVSYGVMRLIVFGLARAEKTPLRFDFRMGVWSAAMGVFCLITIFASLGFDSLDMAVPHVFMGFAPSFIGISIFFFFVETHRDEPYIPQDGALRHRGLGFYAAVAVALIFIPCFTFRVCWYGFRSLLGWMPVGLAASSLALNAYYLIRKMDGRW